MRVKEFLDYTSSVAVIGVCLLIGGSFINDRFLVPRPKPVQGLRTGQVFPAIKGINYADKKLTMLFFANTQCAACLQSVPDIKKVAGVVEGTRRAQAFGVFSESQSQLAAHRELGFALPSVTVQSFAPYSVAATPTTIVVNQEGRIQNIWIGRMETGTLERLLKDLA